VILSEKQDVIRERKLRQGGAVWEKRGGALWRVAIYRQCLRSVNGSGKVIVDPQPDSDKHQNFITSVGSSLAYAYYVCL